MKNLTKHLLLAVPLVLGGMPVAHAEHGKLQEAAGVMQFEGSGGGGLVPWATIAGGSSRDETAGTVFSTRVSVDDYQMNVWGAAIGMRDRIEVSAAHQTFDLSKLGGEISQNVMGVKVRMFGDVVYGNAPQMAVGAQYKRLINTDIAQAVGADDADTGMDLYVAMSKAHLGALFGRNVFWNLTIRATEANQYGLLGFGGDKHDTYEAMIEGSAAVFLQRSLAIGAEYRQKPDNLGFAKEEDARDLFVAFIPNKQFSLTGGWADLGDIAGAKNQDGPYLSLSANLW